MQIGKIKQLETDLQIEHEQISNLELQMQAQFDEWVHEQEQSLEEKLKSVKDFVQAEV